MDNFEERIAEFETRSYSAAYDAQGDASALMREMLAALQAERQGNAVLRKVGKELRDTLSEADGLFVTLRDYELPKLEAALQAKDAEIAELTMQRGADEQVLLMWQRKVERRDAEITDLRGLLGEGLDNLKYLYRMNKKPPSVEPIISRITTALAGKEQPNV
jgi:hypothetical protein